MKQATFDIVGGGIAGVSCAEGMSFLAPDESVIVISASPMIKKVTNIRNLTKMLSEFSVEEQSSSQVSEEFPSVSVLHDSVVGLDHEKSLVILASGETVGYERLCICSGAYPKLIGNNPHIVGIRDTDSVQEFQSRLAKSKKVVIVGNGGIATELVHETSGVEIVWVIKDKHISATFIDPGAAEFFQSRLKKKVTEEEDEEPAVVKRMKYTVGDGKTSQGAALGPDWHAKVNLKGLLERSNVSIEYSCEVKNVLDGDDAWPVYVELTNDKLVGCDVIVSATGVVPNVDIFKDCGAAVSEDGGLKVNWKMQTSLENVYAAGDACSVNWDLAPQWFQMRLWTQARHMGTYAAKSMVCDIRGEELLQDFCFELFTHATKLFGMKVVLLGLFNGQTLNDSYEILLRVTKGVEYVKLVLKDGRMQGAVLIGDTDLEEMCENLILNQLDLTSFGEDLLNPPPLFAQNNR
uniref:Pyridine nucleotide-disulfide oxidoreductase domain-containing protein 1 n=2 Tax=Lygus hesperus TaxID=30085 RepID=A0A0K8SBP7_LYGHE